MGTGPAPTAVVVPDIGLSMTGGCCAGDAWGVANCAKLGYAAGLWLGAWKRPRGMAPGRIPPRADACCCAGGAGCPKAPGAIAAPDSTVAAGREGAGMATGACAAEFCSAGAHPEGRAPLSRVVLPDRAIWKLTGA